MRIYNICACGEIKKECFFFSSGTLYKGIAQNLLARTSEQSNQDLHISYPLYFGLNRTAQIHDSVRADILLIH